MNAWWNRCETVKKPGNCMRIYEQDKSSMHFDVRVVFEQTHYRESTSCCSNRIDTSACCSKECAAEVVLGLQWPSAKIIRVPILTTYNHIFHHAGSRSLTMAGLRFLIFAAVVVVVFAEDPRKLPSLLDMLSASDAALIEHVGAAETTLVNGEEVLSTYRMRERQCRESTCVGLDDEKPNCMPQCTSPRCWLDTYKADPVRCISSPS